MPKKLPEKQPLHKQGVHPLIPPDTMVGLNERVKNGNVNNVRVLRRAACDTTKAIGSTSLRLIG